MTAPPDFEARWGASGLAAIASAATVRATIDARTLPAAGAAGAATEIAPSAPGGATIEAWSRPTVDLARAAATDGPGAAVDPLATLPALALATADDAASGSAELTVVGLLGEGGMGRVLLARQRSLARDVAVKVAKPSADRGTHVALLAEARVLGRLEHPSIVPVHALGRDPDGNPVLVMKRIEGVPWSALVADPGHPFWTELATAPADRRAAHLEILVTVCGAVHYAHRRGVIHRDLKPDNVMIGGFGEVYVTDWGIALARASIAPGAARAPTFGTPAYMAPEMIGGDPRAVDERTDVYLLGAILHEVLTGAQRNPGRTVIEAMRSAAAPAPVRYPADVPDELAAIANRATAAAPEDRFPDAQALQRAIVDHLRHEGSIALCDAATAKLAELRAAIATPAGDRSAEAAADVERLGTECRFAYLASLRAWADNRAAKEGLAACVEGIVGDRIARGDAHGARALIAELGAPPAGLADAIAALEASLAVQAGELRRLEAMQRDLDPGVAARERSAFMALVLLASVGVVALLYVVPGAGDPEAKRLVVAPTALLVIASVALAVTGRKRLATSFNRKAGALVVLGLALNVLHRVIALRAGDDHGAIHRSDALMLAAVLFAAGITQRAAIAIAGLPLVAAAAFMPASARGQVVVFGLSAAAATAIATIAAGARPRGP